jgi:hypothetical protein
VNSTDDGQPPFTHFRHAPGAHQRALDPTGDTPTRGTMDTHSSQPTTADRLRQHVEILCSPGDRSLHLNEASMTDAQNYCSAHWLQPAGTSRNKICTSRRNSASATTSVVGIHGPCASIRNCEART